MTTRLALVAGVAALAVAAPAAAAPARITEHDARASARVVLGLLGDALEERVVVDRCRRYATVWRTCAARIGPDRYVMKARYKNRGGDVLVYARRSR